jgi:hypothetical protein
MQKEENFFSQHLPDNIQSDPEISGVHTMEEKKEWEAHLALQPA